MMRFGRVEIDGWSVTAGYLSWMPAEKRRGRGKRLFGYWGNRAANLCEACGAVVMQPPN